MKHFTTNFFRGLFTLLPILLSVYVFIYFLTWVENFSRWILLKFLPNFFYIPGMGVILVVLAIYGFGVIIDRPLAQWIFRFVEDLFREMPVIKTVYLAIKDFTEYLKPSENRKNNQVVLVKFPDGKTELIGLMTRESLVGLPDEVTKTGRVAVYFPMSYQFGGYTVFVPKSWVHPTDMGVEEALRSIITAWLPGETPIKGKL